MKSIFAFPKRLNLFAGTLLLLTSLPAIAQQDITPTAEDAVPVLFSASSPRGNWLFLYNNETGAADSNTYNATDYFIVERINYDTTKAVEKVRFREIGTARAATSMRKLNALFTNEDLAQLAEITRVSSTDALPAFIDAHRNIEPYPFVYNTLRMRVALGHVFLDEGAQPGTPYYYHVTRVSKDGTKKLWGRALQMAKPQNAALLQYHPLSAGKSVTDSSLSLTWKLPLRNRIYEPQQPKEIVFAYNDEALLIEQLLMSRLYVIKNGKLLEPTLSMGALNATEDTLTYNMNLRTLPEDEISAWTVAEDLVGNQGGASDTVFAVSLTYEKAPIITQLDVKSIVDGLHLSWPPLPQKPYLSGIRIMRYNTSNELQEVALLPPTDTAYDDYQMVLGNHYRYQVFAQFAKGISFVQPVGAQGVGTYEKFSKPEPPANLKAENVGRNIAISWDSSTTRGFFGYHIYRGFDGQPLTMLAGPLQTTSFLDTAVVLNGKSVYTYAVVAQNLKQDTSLLSQPVSIRPLRPVEMVSPASVNTYFANGKLRISWEDARKRDAYIAGYQLQKRTGEEGAFIAFGLSQTDNETSDSAIVPGVAYAYRVAPVGTQGEVGDYSPATDFLLEEEGNFSTVALQARNTDAGVALSWTGAESPAVQSYIVYRRLATETTFSPLERLPKGTVDYTDRAAQAGGRYVYAVALAFTGGNEGPKSDSRSITYEPQPKAEVLN